MTSIITTKPGLVPVTGWTMHHDANYTLAVPQVITNTKTKLTCDDLGSLTNIDQRPIGESTGFFNSATNLVEPTNLNDVLSYRITIQVTPSNANVVGTLSLEIEDTPKVNIGSQVVIFPDSAERTVTLITSSFTLANYITNGASVYVESEGGTLNVYDLKILVERTHKGRV